jgi:hypothetical protein
VGGAGGGGEGEFDGVVVEGLEERGGRGVDWLVWSDLGEILRGSCIDRLVWRVGGGS